VRLMTGQRKFTMQAGLLSQVSIGYGDLPNLVMVTREPSSQSTGKVIG
jgi:hypothetical protein